MNYIDNKFGKSETNFDFGNMPIANAFGPKDQNIKKFHMIADYFDNYKLVKLRDQPENVDMFNENYAFFTSTSKGMVSHFENTALKLKDKLGLDKTKKVIEIGCNDGSFLNAVKKITPNILGIEPSSNVAEFAKNNGIRVDVEFFGKGYSKLFEYKNTVDLIYAANVICHIPDIFEVIETAEILLNTDGFFVFEDPYLGSMINKGSFDQIYDEHTYIFSVEAVRKIAAECGLKLVECEWLPTHGGSMRYYLQKTNSKINKIENWIDYEQMFIGVEQFNSFKMQVDFSKKIMKGAMERFQNENLRVDGLGATSKSTTILNYFGLNEKNIRKIYDNSPQKIGKFTPTTKIPVVSDQEFNGSDVDVIFLFAWNHEMEIIKHYSSQLKNVKIITHLKKDIESLI